MRVLLNQKVRDVFQCKLESSSMSRSARNRSGLQTYAHPDLCDHFFLCTNGTVTVEQCENGLLFDGKGSVHKHCNYNWAVDCGARKYEGECLLNFREVVELPALEQLVDLCPPSIVHLHTRPELYYYLVSTLSIRSVRAGLFSKGQHEATCPSAAQDVCTSSASTLRARLCSTNYLKCEYGVAHQTPCEPGLAYDDKTHSCNWPDLLLDTCNPEAILGFKCPTKVPSNTVAAKFWPFPRFAIPGDCGRLITCVNNFPRLISCGDDKVFDEETLTCEDPDVVPKCRDVYVRFIAGCPQQNTRHTAVKSEPRQFPTLHFTRTVNDDPQNVFPSLDGLVGCLLLIVVCSTAVIQDVEVCSVTRLAPMLPVVHACLNSFALPVLYTETLDTI
uniref:(California timema) hypothetical protein n=1 Tax=Timema californicum TaxID=61474 RepID=A0A7R9JGM8_TIMCA|nr:unnamed protein product [Timema californicum]